MLAVEIAAEIEEMGLEPEIFAADRRPPAEIGGAVMPFGLAAVFDASANGIDPGCRPEVIGEIDIGRWKADRVAGRRRDARGYGSRNRRFRPPRRHLMQRPARRLSRRSRA